MKTTLASRLIETLTTYGPSIIAQLENRLGVPSKQISSTISLINSGKTKESARIVSERTIGSRAYIYSLSDTNVIANESRKDDAVVVLSKKSQRDIASEALIGYIGDEMRSDFEAALSEILPKVIESALCGMSSDIRAAMASAFGKRQTVAADDILIPATITITQVAKTATESAKPAPVEIPAPVVNVLSTRTKPREKTKAAPIPEPAKVAEGRNRKALVVGLHSNKQEFIRREFRDCFELRLYTPDQMRAIQECVKSGDLAFLMADFISHKHQDILQNAGAEVVVVHGGISSLREAMTTAYVGNEDKKAA